LNAPEKVIAATQEYREDSDPVGEWIAQKCVVRADARQNTSDLFKSYVHWADDMKYERMDSNVFGKALKAKGFKSKRTKTARVCLGIALKDAADEKLRIAMEQCRRTVVPFPSRDG
jgi:putative DNA primase/helicase